MSNWSRPLTHKTEDEICKPIKQYCSDEWPDKYQLPSILKPYWDERGELLVNEDVILKSWRNLIPSSMRLEVMNKLYMQVLGRDLFYSQSIECLLVVDYSSRFVEVSTSRKTRQQSKFRGLKAIFAKQGILDNQSN